MLARGVTEQCLYVFIIKRCYILISTPLNAMETQRLFQHLTNELK